MYGLVLPAKAIPNETVVRKLNGSTDYTLTRQLVLHSTLGANEPPRSLHAKNGTVLLGRAGAGEFYTHDGETPLLIPFSSFQELENFINDNYPEELED